jgi:hypothetical protein
MLDRIFAPALAFLMLLAGTVTLAAGFFPGTRNGTLVATSDIPAPAATEAPAAVMLEPVLIHIKRSDALRRLQEEDSLQRGSSVMPNAVMPKAMESRGAMLHLVRH